MPTKWRIFKVRYVSLTYGKFNEHEMTEFGVESLKFSEEMGLNQILDIQYLRTEGSVEKIKHLI
jgi:hypothetical protein